MDWKRIDSNDGEEVIQTWANEQVEGIKIDHDPHHDDAPYIVYRKDEAGAVDWWTRADTLEDAQQVAELMGA